MAITGALQGLGNEGAAIEQARQQHEAEVRQALIDRLAQNQDTRAQQELDLRKRSEAQREKQAGAPVAVGNPYRAADGKTYQRYADPNTGQITAKAIDEPEEESPIQAITREIGQAEAAGIKLTPEQKQAIIEAKLGGKSLVSNRANRFGSFVQDPDSPTGFSRQILDGTTLEPTGRKDYGLPSGALPKERTGYKVMTTEDGSQYLVPITTTTRTPGVKPAGATGGGAKGGSTTPSSANAPKPTSAPANTTSSDGLPKGAKPFGHKPLSQQDRQTIVAAKTSDRAIDRMLTMFNNRRELQDDNSPITPAVDWFEYQRLHMEPSDPIRSQLIKESALVGITLSGLYARGRMSRYLFDKAQQHLPQPNDSPKLLYSKIRWLRDNHLLDDVVKDTMNPLRSEDKPPAVTQPKPASPNPNDPLGIR